MQLFALKIAYKLVNININKHTYFIIKKEFLVNIMIL